MKLLIMHFYPNSYHFISLRSKPSQSIYSSLNVRDQVSHPCRTTDKIIVLCILIFTFLNVHIWFKINFDK
jgi:hypothetical protein